ncbi:group 1 glycosyl transferase [Salinisphaera dokdonensis CL-ES53]|uniref:Group 1 glycosyl transferase n=2 Tax=Salinisphaera TaxID=180541 RepID=A0ABV2AVT7_9GAMM
MGWALVVGRIAALLLRLPLVVTFHNELGRYNPGVRWALKLLPQKRCVLTGVSSAVCQQWESWLRRPVELIPNPLKIDSCTKSNLKREHNGPVRLVVVSRLTAIKRVDFSLRLLKALIDAGTAAELVIVGDGPEGSALQNLTEDLGISKHVSFLGFQSDVSGCLDWSDYFVLSSLYEGFCMAAIEAMARGSLLVAHRLPAISDYAQDGVNAVVTEECSVSEWCSRIKSLEQDRSQLFGMKYAAWRLVREKFAPDLVAQHYARAYDGLLAACK